MFFFYVRNVDACEKYRINYVGDLLLFADIYVSFVMDKRISKVKWMSFTYYLTVLWGIV